jgi:hypothetical protein
MYFGRALPRWNAQQVPLEARVDGSERSRSAPLEGGTKSDRSRAILYMYRLGDAARPVPAERARETCAQADFIITGKCLRSETRRSSMSSRWSLFAVDVERRPSRLDGRRATSGAALLFGGRRNSCFEGG